MFARFDTIVPLVLTVLLEAAWQPLVIAAITWAVLRSMRNTNAATRHAIWLCSFAAATLLPVATAAVLAGGVPPVALTASTPRYSHVQIALAPWLIVTLLAVWTTIAAASLVRLLHGLRRITTLKRASAELAIDVPGGAVRVGISDAIDVPVAIGLFDSTILLPKNLILNLDRDDLDRILLHEFAHLRRKDDWTNLIQHVVQAVLFFSPGIHWIAAQANLEREVACDDWVLERTQASLPYARCLARIVERVAWPPRAVAAPGAFNTRRHISIRIERILSRRRNAGVRVALFPAVAGAAASFAFTVLCATVSPSIAWASSPEGAHAHYASQCPLQRGSALRGQG